jgi:hypothetical protein
VKTFLTALGILGVAFLLAMSGSLFTSDGRPSYETLLGENTELTHQLQAKQLELEDIKQDIKDGLVPCKVTQ